MNLFFQLRELVRVRTFKNGDLAQLSKDYLRVVLFWNPAIAGIFILVFSDFENIWRSFFGSLLIANVITLFCMVGTFAVVKGIQKLLRRTRPLHSGWKMLIANLFLIPGLPMGFWSAEQLYHYAGWPGKFHTFDDYRTGLFNGLIISSLFFLYRIWQDSQREKQEYELKVKTLENETLKARMASLNYQLNPHMLFNSLNTIASMIPQRPEAAEDMTVRLSELYRGILVSSKNSSHSLEKELELVRNYLDIEHARFGDRVKFEIAVDPKINANQVDIPVLLVQPFVENAIKHGLSEKVDGGTVRVRVTKEDSKLRIFVEDDGIGFGNSLNRKGSGTGIENCKQRLKLIYGDHADFQIAAAPPGTQCAVSIPAWSQS